MNVDVSYFLLVAKCSVYKSTALIAKFLSEKIRCWTVFTRK
jgi:hypothetical protein